MTVDHSIIISLYSEPVNWRYANCDIWWEFELLTPSVEDLVDLSFIDQLRKLRLNRFLHWSSPLWFFLLHFFRDQVCQISRSSPKSSRFLWYIWVLHFGISCMVITIGKAYFEYADMHLLGEHDPWLNDSMTVRVRSWLPAAIAYSKSNPDWAHRRRISILRPLSWPWHFCSFHG